MIPLLCNLTVYLLLFNVFVLIKIHLVQIRNSNRISFHLPSHFADIASNKKVMTRLSVEDKLRLLIFGQRSFNTTNSWCSNLNNLTYW